MNTKSDQINMSNENNKIKIQLPKTYVLHIWLSSSFIIFLTNQNLLPASLPNSSSISSLPFDLGMFPTKSRRFGTLMLIFKHLPGLIS